MSVKLWSARRWLSPKQLGSDKEKHQQQSGLRDRGCGATLGARWGSASNFRPKGPRS